MLQTINYQGYNIQIHNFENETNLKDFQVIGDFKHTSTIYNGIDGFIDKTDKGYKLTIYLKTNKNIFIEKYNKKSLNDCIKWIKHYINCFIIDYTIQLSNEKKIHCNFKLNTINIDNKTDLQLICNDLKQNKINFTIEYKLNSYSIRILKNNIISYSDNTITIK